MRNDFTGDFIRKGKRIVVLPYKLYKNACVKAGIRRYYRQTRYMSLVDLRMKTLEYLEEMRIKGSYYGRYKFARSRHHPVLYASIYAAMLRHLYGDLDHISSSEKTGWIEYIRSYQCDDGLFRDPLVANKIAEEADWWGWRHPTCHVICALAALGAKPQKPFTFLELLYSGDGVNRWLESRDWVHNADFVSNEVMNYGVLLQYSRDFFDDVRAAKALDEMYQWLDKHQDPATGLWGSWPENAYGLSRGVQTAYHIWILYFYDRRPINYLEKCIDSCLCTRNAMGGFGTGINSSACEDIDTIDPLSRFYTLTDYRRDDVRKALAGSLRWVLANANDDGGFVFRRCERLDYGHELTSSGADESALFPTWFRTLSLAYLSKAADDQFLGSFKWKMTDCPGYQFWKP